MILGWVKLYGFFKLVFSFYIFALNADTSAFYAGYKAEESRYPHRVADFLCVGRAEIDNCYVPCVGGRLCGRAYY